VEAMTTWIVVVGETRRDACAMLDQASVVHALLLSCERVATRQCKQEVASNFHPLGCWILARTYVS
jgi:Ni/Fe-hydrogenase subunit HybB-like protein